MASKRTPTRTPPERRPYDQGFIVHGFPKKGRQQKTYFGGGTSFLGEGYLEDYPG